MPVFEFISRDAVGHAGNPASAGAAHLDTPDLSVQRLLVIPPQPPLASTVSQMLMDGLFEQLNVELARYREFALASYVRTREEKAVDPVAAGINAQARFVISGSVRQTYDQDSRHRAAP